MKTILMLTTVTAFFIASAVNAASSSEESNVTLEDVIEDEDHVFLPHIGGLFGVVDPGNLATDASIHFGVDMGFQPVNQFGLGLSLTYYSDRKNNPNGYIDSSLFPVLVETSYHFSKYSNLKALSGFHIGTKQGFIFKNEEVSTINATTVNNSSLGFGIGPLVGYDYMISDKFSLGGEFNYVFVIDNKNYNMANLSAALKYWL